jgi:chlorophyll synthase
MVGLVLGPVGAAATLVALALAWAYSAPPFRLKQNGWIGNAAVGLSYEGLAWITGAAVVLAPTTPAPPTLLLATAYSLGAHGIMTLNDFKSIPGDTRLGIASLPATLGPHRAARVACATMLGPQLAVLVSLWLWGADGYAVALGLVLGLQLPLMRRFVAEPAALATWYSAVGVPVYVTGMMVSAIALRALGAA